MVNKKWMLGLPLVDYYSTTSCWQFWGMAKRRKRRRSDEKESGRETGSVLEMTHYEKKKSEKRWFSAICLSLQFWQVMWEERFHDTFCTLGYLIDELKLDRRPSSHFWNASSSFLSLIVVFLLRLGRERRLSKIDVINFSTSLCLFIFLLEKDWARMKTSPKKEKDRLITLSLFETVYCTAPCQHH